MKFLKKFNESLQSVFPTDPEEIAKICRKYKIENYEIRDGGIVDVDAMEHNFHTLDLRPKPRAVVPGMPHETGWDKMKNLPFRFGDLKGTLWARGLGLTTLEGSPGRIYAGGMIVDENLLTDLKGSPDEIDGAFLGGANKFLTSLEGIPKRIGGKIDFRGCPRLWDLRPLRDIQFDTSRTGIQCFDSTPVYRLILTFNSGSGNVMNDFIQSLPYNYIREPILHQGRMTPTLNLFRFKEALEDASVDLVRFQQRYNIQFGDHLPWVYLDDEGNKIYFDGTYPWLKPKDWDV